MRKVYVLISVFVVLGIVILLFAGREFLPGTWWKSEKRLHTELLDINNKIENLINEISEQRLDAMRSEVDAQNYMYSEWETYSEKIKQVENKEVEIHSLEKDLDELMIKRQKLLEAINKKEEPTVPKSEKK